MKTCFVFYLWTAVILVCNVDCEDREEKSSAKDAAATAVVAVATDEAEDDASVEDEPLDFMKDSTGMFEPSDEWKTVEPGQVIPKGLHVRLNMETGEKEAKRMSQKDGSKSAETPEELRVKRMKTAMEQAMRELNDGQQSASSGNFLEDLKYWSHAGREGVMNTKNAYFTHDELKQALKKIKSHRDDVQQPVNKESESGRKFRSIDELRREFDSFNVDLKTDLEILTGIMKRYRQADSLSPDERLAILVELEYYLHQIDNAKNFADMGGLQLVIADLNSTNTEVQNEAARVLSSAVQSNPAVQVIAVEAGALQQLIRLLSIEGSATLRSRLLVAVSSLIRHFPFAQRKFLELGGVQTLSGLLSRRTLDGEKLSLKAVTLVSDLLTERMSLKADEKTSDPQQQERLEQYTQVPLLESVVAHGWCELVPRLLAVLEHDAREKVLGTMWSLRGPCRAEFASHVPALRQLRDEYRQLAADEGQDIGQDQVTSSSDELPYFSELLRTVDNIIDHVTLAKDEL